MRTALYRHYASNGMLLYVGISLSVVQRLAQHRANARWFDEIARVDVEWFENREDARLAEKEAIAQEWPLHNVQERSADAGPWAVIDYSSFAYDGWYEYLADALGQYAWFKSESDAHCLGFNLRVISKQQRVGWHPSWSWLFDIWRDRLAVSAEGHLAMATAQ